MSQPSEPRTLYLISEFPPSAAPPGIRRRLEHLYAWANSRFDSIVRLDLAETRGSKVTRVGAVIRSGWVRKEIPSGSEVLISGLGAVHMLLLAATLSRKFVSTYDACDSWTLQVSARSESSWILAISSRIGRLIQTVATRKLAVSYISQRDADADSRLNRTRLIRVVPASLPASMTTLNQAALRTPISRIAVSADYSAFHNVRGLAMLAAAWPEFVSLCPSIHLDLYGVGDADRLKSVGGRMHGWADDIMDIYSAGTAVFVTNVGGSGVPNKLLEALASGLPVVVHKSHGPFARQNAVGRVIEFSDEHDLVIALQRAIGVSGQES